MVLIDDTVDLTPMNTHIDLTPMNALPMTSLILSCVIFPLLNYLNTIHCL